jgi:hypothetical protein
MWERRMRSSTEKAVEEFLLSEVFVGLQQQVIYRRFTGNRQIHFSAFRTPDNRVSGDSRTTNLGQARGRGAIARIPFRQYGQWR